jgi:hypothetical protein
VAIHAINMNRLDAHATRPVRVVIGREETDRIDTERIGVEGIAGRLRPAARGRLGARPRDRVRVAERRLDRIMARARRT